MPLKTLAGSRWTAAQANPTYWNGALSDGEGAAIRWHSPSDPTSSQVFCISAFGGLRALDPEGKVFATFIGNAFPHLEGRAGWSIRLEHANRDLLGEHGGGTPTCVDVFVECDGGVVCVESKFVHDALEGFGSCSQARRGACRGFYGPGSDAVDRTKLLGAANCRLEAHDGRRKPRKYWELGRRYFQRSVFELQQHGASCPFAGPHFQLMRNFLFAAAAAGPAKRFGVLAIAPETRSKSVKLQVSSFQDRILRPEFRMCVQVATYETLSRLLKASPRSKLYALGQFLEDRMDTLL